MSDDLSQVTFIGRVMQFCEKVYSFIAMPSTLSKSRYFFHSHFLTFHSLVQLLLPVVKLNGISQPISIEYKMVHGLNQAVFRTYNLENLAILNLFSFQLCFRTGIRCYIA